MSYRPKRSTSSKSFPRQTYFLIRQGEKPVKLVAGLSEEGHLLESVRKPYLNRQTLQAGDEAAFGKATYKQILRAGRADLFFSLQGGESYRIRTYEDHLATLDPSHRVTGKTYPVKDWLSQQGCLWSSEHKAWIAPDADTQKRCQAQVDAAAKARADFESQRKTCWECGGLVTYREVKQNDGDWNEDVLGPGSCYCGC